MIFALNAIQAMFHFWKCSAHLLHTTQISLGCQSCVFLWVNNCKPTTAVHLIDFQSNRNYRNAQLNSLKLKKKTQTTKPVIVRKFFIISETENVHNFIVVFSFTKKYAHFDKSIERLRRLGRQKRLAMD